MGYQIAQEEYLVFCLNKHPDAKTIKFPESGAEINAQHIEDGNNCCYLLTLLEHHAEWELHYLLLLWVT